MKKFIIGAAIAVAGVAAWAASDTNAFNFDAEANMIEVCAYGKPLGYCSDTYKYGCDLTDGYITYYIEGMFKCCEIIRM